MATSAPDSSPHRPPERSPGILGREEELHRLSLLLGNARNGRGGSLLLIGEPGIGKTTLLRRGGSGPGFRVLAADGFEAESALPYAGLQRLCRPLEGAFDGVPERHRRALEIALGLADGPAPDRYLVGLGLLGLFAGAATASPLVCRVDDAHLMDPETLDALAFVARRLLVEPVALLFAGRDEAGLVERLSGVPELTLSGLEPEAALELLAATAVGPVDPAAAAQIAHATGGNPLALIDLATAFSPAMLAELGVSSEPVPIGRRLESHYASTVRAAGAEVATWVLLAAADATGDVDLLAAAAAVHGLGAEALDGAEASGLIEVRGVVRFRHPLVRSAVYNAAGGPARRRAHAALAVAAEELGLVEREAWHAARATVGTDAGVADRLEQVADLAGRRGGVLSRATTLARAADLTPDGPVRDARRVGAAEAALGAGAAHLAARLLDHLDGHAETGTAGVDPVLRGRTLQVRAALSLFNADPVALSSAPATLVAAADLFRGRAPDLEQRALLRAFDTLAVTERAARGVTPSGVGRRLAEGADAADGPLAEVLRGLAALIELPYADAVGPARVAFGALLALPDEQYLEMGVPLAALGAFLWDEAGRSAALGRAAALARDAGALQALDALLWIMSLAELSGGTVTRAVAFTEAVREVRRTIGYGAENVINAAVMAWTGSPRDVVLAIGEGAAAIGFGGVGSAAVAAVAARDLADGGYRDAFDRLRPLIEDPFLQVTPLQLPDYVEAAARCGHLAEARAAAARLAALASANQSSWCRGVAERAAALVADGAEAEKHFLASEEALASTEAEVDLGRTLLVHGEWLRRARRRAEAGRRLQEAIRILERSGADTFLPRARAELEACGLRPDPRAGGPGHDLTPREQSVAEQAAAGRTNAEIAANLYLSPNTVDYHLRKVFQKLGVTSRRQLADRLAAGG
ncbi:helix-turn-helix transcriptional regulator [Nocardioides sp. GY 10113]|uniref:LuxR family transcriptional regulator n=1 Tax=Nocardioides sp. GY 10113 TaxID=2569761 RepID=UPI0010A7CA9A|nr:LuxR family transcriptional regulator [Nocardioides sp. GY 10113]TIC84880.1 helix-turn-helix transcriptional regulator [Nocardioides sp. GY 10113]